MDRTAAVTEFEDDHDREYHVVYTHALNSVPWTLGIVRLQSLFVSASSATIGDTCTRSYHHLPEAISLWHRIMSREPFWQQQQLQHHRHHHKQPRPQPFWQRQHFMDPLFSIFWLLLLLQSAAALPYSNSVRAAARRLLQDGQQLLEQQQGASQEEHMQQPQQSVLPPPPPPPSFIATASNSQEFFHLLYLARNVTEIRLSRDIKLLASDAIAAAAEMGVVDDSTTRKGNGNGTDVDTAVTLLGVGKRGPLLGRNLTIVGISRGTHTRLDTNFLAAILRLESGVRLTLRRVELYKALNQIGQVLEFIGKSNGGLIELQDCVQRRAACLPFYLAAPQLMSLPDAIDPSLRNQTRDMVLRNDSAFCWSTSTLLATCKLQSMDVQSIAVHVPVEDGIVADSGGYDVSYIDSRIVCDYPADPACLQASAADQCLSRELVRRFGDEAVSSTPPGRPSMSPGGQEAGSGSGSDPLQPPTRQLPAGLDSKVEGGGGSQRHHRRVVAMVAGLAGGGGGALLVLSSLLAGVMILKRRQRRDDAAGETVRKKSIETYCPTSGGGVSAAGSGEQGAAEPRSRRDVQQLEVGMAAAPAAGAAVVVAAAESGKDAEAQATDAVGGRGEGPGGRGDGDGSGSSSNILQQMSSSTRSAGTPPTIRRTAAVAVMPPPTKHPGGSCGGGGGDDRAAAALAVAAVGPAEAAARAAGGEMSETTESYDGPLDPDHLDVESVRQSLRRAVLRHPGVPLQVQVLSLLGEGSFGKVYKAIWQGTVVALKALVLSGNLTQDQRRRQMAVMEAAISSSMSHPNIVHTYTYSFRPIYDTARSDGASISGNGSGIAGADKASDDHKVSGGQGPDAAAADISELPRVHGHELLLVLEYCDRGSLRQALDAGLFHRHCTSGGGGGGGSPVVKKPELMRDLSMDGQPGSNAAEVSCLTPATEFSTLAPPPLPPSHAYIPPAAGEAKLEGGGLDWESSFVRQQQTDNHQMLYNYSLMLQVACEIASALLHLHNHGVVHGDVKASNVLLKTAAQDDQPDQLIESAAASGGGSPCAATAAGGGVAGTTRVSPSGSVNGTMAAAAAATAAASPASLSWPPLTTLTSALSSLTRTGLTAKVADFGLSTVMGLSGNAEETHITALTAQGSLTHMAPELMLHGHISKRVDVYAFGILLYELFTGDRAHRGVPRALLPHQVAIRGLRPALPYHTPPDFRRLAEACWAAEPTKRPTFAAILADLEHMRAAHTATAAAISAYTSNRGLSFSTTTASHGSRSVLSCNAVRPDGWILVACLEPSTCSSALYEELIGLRASVEGNGRGGGGGEGGGGGGELNRAIAGEEPQEDDILTLTMGPPVGLAGLR